jgi:hypothetical protein
MPESSAEVLIMPGENKRGAAPGGTFEGTVVAKPIGDEFVGGYLGAYRNITIQKKAIHTTAHGDTG